MKKNIIYIGLIFVICFLILYVISFIGKNHRKNSFDRKFIDGKIEISNIIELPDKLYGLVAETNEGVVLKSYADPLHLFKVKYPVKKMDTIFLKYPVGFNQKVRNIYKAILSSNLYASNSFGDMSLFIDGKSTLYRINNLRTDNIRAISNKTIIARARHNYGKQINRALVKLNISDSIAVDKKYLLPDQINGFFTNDGWLLYDKKNARVLYLYYYRGEFLNLDTNLNLIYKGKTIDTVRFTKTKTGLITTRGRNGRPLKQITQTTPPHIVNIFMATSNDRLYILSKLKADNEEQSSFDNNQVIDVYNILDGKYLHSFYIPRYNDLKTNEFLVNGSTLTAIFGKYLITYSLRA